jgi:hypothetical protein
MRRIGDGDACTVEDRDDVSEERGEVLIDGFDVGLDEGEDLGLGSVKMVCDDNLRDEAISHISYIGGNYHKPSGFVAGGLPRAGVEPCGRLR